MLMRIGLHLVHLDSFEEGLPLAGDLLVLNGYHLVEIDCAILFVLLERVLLVSESARTTAKRFHMIPGA